MLCPVCKAELADGSVECRVCGWELSSEEKGEWVIAGWVLDPVFADLAKETLKSMEIPAVVVSKSGFFGNIGLTLNPFFRPDQTPHFEVMVPHGYLSDAMDALDGVLGEKWKAKED